ncbi:unnamed protein product [Blepharisma stoltei]|uniref:non-specific serine/threonine protein kinase n=1 Tax=Blepharisma stoltei TaxID=1481888 RepID=A0AAU9IT75_9CILI|nr:unnamed protein product [Blepharisma stoltei]
MGNICNKDSTPAPSIPRLRRKKSRLPTYNCDITTQYEIGKVIGMGNFGAVRIGYPKKNPTHKVAIKSIDKARVRCISQLHLEVEILSSLDHPNIIKLHEIYEGKRFYHIVMEYCTGGDLMDKMLKKVNFTEKEAGEIMKKILGIVNHLHKVNICHRDLKCENFMYEDDEPNSELKLIDFGLSKKFRNSSNKMSSIVGTPYYVAPEVLKGVYGPECDLWSAGVIMYALLCGNFPFYGENKVKIFKQIMDGNFEFTDSIWKEISGLAKDLIHQLLTVDVSNRITAENALHHPWFKYLEMNHSQRINPKIIDSFRRFRVKSTFQREAMGFLVRDLESYQIADLKEAFLSLDKNNEGFLTLQDIEDALKDDNYNNINKELEICFLNADGNGDGRLSYSEFLAATLAAKDIVDEDLLLRIFKHFDVKGNGKITAESFEEAIKRSGRKGIDGEKAIAEVDSKDKGYISFDEFKEILKIESLN